jgi:hypothetical protein
MSKKTPKKKKDNTDLYAGPTFQNSPCPSALPTPSFTKNNSPPTKNSLDSYDISSPQVSYEHISPSQVSYEHVSPPQVTHDHRVEEQTEIFQMDPIQQQMYYPHPPYGYPPMYPYPQKNTKSIELENMSRNLKNVLGL